MTDRIPFAPYDAHHISESDAAKVAHEFPSYDLATLPPIPEGFESTAWHNETCPTWHEGSSDASPKQGDMMLAIDYPVDDDRECPGGDRFNLAMYDGQDNPIFVASSNDWAVVENAIMFARYVRHLGLGFHVDTSGRCYVEADGTRTFTDAEAEEYDHVIYEAHAEADPYEAAINIWMILGLIDKSEATPPQAAITPTSGYQVKRWLVENQLTDNKIGVVEAESAREAIDAAYRAHGWKSFADAREQRATAAEEHEIVARRIDIDGNEFGPFIGYEGNEF